MENSTLNDLIDLARNVGGIDDNWLVNADRRSLWHAVHEFREQARAILSVIQPDPFGPLPMYEP
jgi:hypothetical protein